MSPLAFGTTDSFELFPAMSSNVETSCSFQSQDKWLKILREDSNSRMGSLPSQPYTFNIIILIIIINAPGSCSTICLQKCPCWNFMWMSAILSLMYLYLRQCCWPSCFYRETEDSDSAFNAATPTYAQNISIFTFVSVQEMILSFKGRKVPLNGYYIRLPVLSPPQNHELCSQLLKKNQAGVAKIQNASK